MEQYGNTRLVRVNAAVDTGAHTANDIVANLALGPVGGRTGHGVLKDVAITDDANQKAPLILHFFAGSLSGGTYALNGALAISEADAALYLGYVEFPADKYQTVGTKALGSVECALSVRSSTPDNDGVLTCVAVTTGTPDYAAADDLRFKFGILAD